MFTLSALDPLIAQQSLLKHPFYQKWSKGELTLEDLRVYAKEYFHLVERIPGIVARVRDRATNAKFRGQIDANMREEQEHVALWKRFAQSLGVSERELAAHQPSPTVRSAVASLESLAEEGLEQGIVAMYAMEAELPAIAATKKQGLCDFYDLQSEDAHVYFDEHLAEEKHLQVWRGVNVSPAVAVPAAEASLAAQNRVLDGVCASCGIPLHCSVPAA